MNEARSELQGFPPTVRRSLFDESCNFLRPGDVYRVAGACDLDLVAVGSGGVPTFEVGVDGPVCSRYQHPAGFAFPCSRGDNCFEVVGEIGHLRSRHESGLLRGEVGCEVLMKLRGVEVSETVCRLLDRARFAEVTWETLSVIRLILSSVRHVGRDV